MASMTVIPSPRGPFFRMGEPIIIPVGPDTAMNEIAVDMPNGATSFVYTNPNPFSVRLRGTRAGQEFRPVSTTTGWLWLPGTQGVRTTLGPAILSAMSVNGPYAASAPEQVAGVGVIELQYGMGGGV